MSSILGEKIAKLTSLHIISYQLNVNVSISSITTYFVLSDRVTRDLSTPGLIVSARAPFSEIKKDFSFTTLCSLFASKSSCA